MDDLTELVVPERLTHLTLEAPHPVEGLAWLTAFPRLRTVSVLADLDEAVARQVPDGVELQGPFASLSSRPQG